MDVKLNDDQYNQILAALQVSCSISIYESLSLFLGLLIVIATVVYAYFTFGLLKVGTDQLSHLKKTVDDANQKSIQDLELQRRRMQNDRIINISYQWNSIDYVKARNRAAVAIARNGGKPLFYNRLRAAGQLDEWINISTVAHFIRRLDKLVSDEQVDWIQTRLEFETQITYWCPKIAPLYAELEEENGVVEACDRLLRLVSVL